VRTTLVKEEEKASMMAMMDIDLYDSVKGHEPSTRGNLLEPSRVEVVHIMNGMDRDRIESDRKYHNLWWGLRSRRIYRSKISHGNKIQVIDIENQRLGPLVCQ
jgi:hypothetical protein